MKKKMLDRQNFDPYASTPVVEAITEDGMETLYRKRTGKWFIYRTDDTIIPITPEEAKVWAKKNLSDTEYNILFPSTPSCRSGIKKVRSIYIDTGLIEKVYQKAGEMGKSFNDMIETMIESFK